MPYRLPFGKDQFKVTKIYAAQKKPDCVSSFCKIYFLCKSTLPVQQHALVSPLLPPFFLKWAQECTSMSLAHDLLV